MAAMSPGLQALKYGSSIAGSLSGMGNGQQPTMEAPVNMNPQLAASLGYMPQGMAQQYQPGGYGGVQYGGTGYGYPAGGTGYGMAGGGMAGGGMAGGGYGISQPMTQEQAQAQMWAAQTGYTGVYAQVESGPPIIMNPETGKPYPPGFTPTVQNPYTHDLYQPFEKMQEAKQLRDAEAAAARNKFLENTLGKWEGEAADRMLEEGRKSDEQLIKDSEALGKDPKGFITGKLNEWMGGGKAASGGTAAATPGGGKTGGTKPGITPSTPQTPREMGQQLGGNIADGIRGIGSNTQKTGNAIIDFGQGFLSGAGLVNDQVKTGVGAGIRGAADQFNSNFPVEGPTKNWGYAQTSQGSSGGASMVPSTGIRR